MIEIHPRYDDIEVRVLKTVLSRPATLASVDDLAVDDFQRLPHRVLWQAIREVEWATRPDPVASSSDLIALCSAWLASRDGAVDGSGYALMADELIGQVPPQFFDRSILRADTTTAVSSLIRQIRADAALLIMARRAREHVRQQVNGASA